ncbi:MAG TPA: ABC transporter ATP-binding protein [Solirubrobacteraceae bacterium]|nr:ABC transporter ATP-binding protein [Solirubrobacteraceae bacterium]
MQALRGVDLDISRGEILALLGPNGAGKSTLMSIVAGLVKPDAGHIWIEGLDLADQTDAARCRMGLAPQETGVYPTLSVEENLRYFGEIAGQRGSALTRRLRDVADGFALSKLLQRPGRALSGGERRRLHTAMIVMHRPALLLLDEPTTGVDVETRAKLLEVIRKLADDGTAICYSTHYLHEVEQISASVAVLKEGCMVACCPLSDLISTYGTSAIHMQFEGVAPTLGARRTYISGTDLHIIVANKPPALELGEIIGELGQAAQRLKTVELIQPSLESVFLILTGQRSRAAANEPDRHEIQA